MNRIHLLPGPALVDRLLAEVVAVDDDAFAPRIALMDEVALWVEDEQPDHPRVPTNQFVYTALRDAGFQDVKRGGTWGFVGLSLRESAPDHIDDFVAEALWLEAAGSWTPMVSVQGAYLRWCGRHNVTPVSASKLYKAIDSLGVARARRRPYRGAPAALWGFLDIQLRPSN